MEIPPSHFLQGRKFLRQRLVMEIPPPEASKRLQSHPDASSRLRAPWTTEFFVPVNPSFGSIL